MSDPVVLPDPATAWWRCSGAELAGALRELEVLRCRVEAVQGQVLAEVESRGVFAEYGYGNLESWQRHLLRISWHEGRKRAARASWLNDTREGGRVVAPLVPQAAEAFAAGAINSAHVDEIAAVVSEFPGVLSDTDRAGYEKILVELARQSHPGAVKRAGREILDRVNPDGKQPRDRDPDEPERELLLSWSRDNVLRLKGRLDTETGHLLESLLSPLAKPRPREEGRRDPRSSAERHGDAFAELLEFTQRAAQLPTEAGETPTVVVTMTLAQLLRLNPRATAGDAAAIMGTAVGPPSPTLNWESPISAEAARRMACEARIIPAVLGSRGEVLDLGRAVRTATPAQRRALALRDKGCIMDGCTRPVRWCQVHHLKHWVDNGPSDLDNMCLLCSEHHRLIHHGGWTIRMAPDGHPECIPPPWFDPHQRPRRNTPIHLDPYLNTG